MKHRSKVRDVPITVDVRRATVNKESVVDEVFIPELKLHLEQMDDRFWYLGIGEWQIYASIKKDGAVNWRLIEGEGHGEIEQVAK